MSNSDAHEILLRLREAVPKGDSRAVNYLAELERLIADMEGKLDSSSAEVAEYRAAYEKLTQPANRTGIFLGWANEDETHASIVVAASEFVALVDPKVDKTKLNRGVRVRVNEAYAIVGVLDTQSAGYLSRISEVLDGGRLKLGSETPGGISRVVLRSAHLDAVVMAPGDDVRLDSTGQVAVEHWAKSENHDYFFEEIPQTPWEAVGGQDEAIKVIRETIELPLVHPEIYQSYQKHPPKGILLYGPPGCGKTLLGKATAYNLTQEYSKQVGRNVKEYFMMISGPKILNMWLGETERMVREIFETAREKAKEGRLVFIFMDEAESVLRTRSSGKWLNISNTVVPQFCAELDGLVNLENVVLMLTSNRPDYIDPAVLRPERIDRKIRIKRPDRAASISIMGIYLNDGLPLDPELLAKFGGERDCARRELVESTIHRLWSRDDSARFLQIHLRNGQVETLYRSDLVSGALLKSVVERAKTFAIRRAIEVPKKPHGLTLEDLNLALDQEFAENEIFPKSDTVEDWLKLLDYEPEAVVSVKPVAAKKAEKSARRVI